MSENPHSTCKDCEETFGTPLEAFEHRMTTLDAAPADGFGNKRGHTTYLINPTEDERIKTLIQDAISAGIDKALEEIDDLIYRGKVNEEDVDKVMVGYYDFQDAWDDWKAESE